MSGEASNFKITSTELYGFVAWVFSAILILVFSLWAFLPDSFLQSFGVYYFPSKYWLCAFANFVPVTCYYITFMNYLVSQRKCHSRDSYFTLVDRHTKLMTPKKIAADQSNTRIAEIQDLPITVVNRVLYDINMETDLIVDEDD